VRGVAVTQRDLGGGAVVRGPAGEEVLDVGARLRERDLVALAGAERLPTLGALPVVEVGQLGLGQDDLAAAVVVSQAPWGAGALWHFGPVMVDECFQRGLRCGLRGRLGCGLVAGREEGEEGDG
jgi:hypothetical protein